MRLTNRLSAAFIIVFIVCDAMATSTEKWRNASYEPQIASAMNFPICLNIQLTNMTKCTCNPQTIQSITGTLKLPKNSQLLPLSVRDPYNLAGFSICQQWSQFVGPSAIFTYQCGGKRVSFKVAQHFVHYLLKGDGTPYYDVLETGDFNIYADQIKNATRTEPGFISLVIKNKV